MPESRPGVRGAYQPVLHVEHNNYPEPLDDLAQQLDRILAMLRSPDRIHKNLNADLLDGYHASDFVRQSGGGGGSGHMTNDNLTADRDLQFPNVDGTAAAFTTYPTTDGRIVATNGTAGGVEASDATINDDGDIATPGEVSASGLVSVSDGVAVGNGAGRYSVVEVPSTIGANRSFVLPDVDVGAAAGFPTTPITAERVIVSSGTVGLVEASPVQIDVDAVMSGVSILHVANGGSFGGAVTGVTPTVGADLATKDYVDGVAVGVNWLPPVIESLATPPGTPTTGDRYRVIATASGAWTGREDDIAEWNGASWDFTTPSANDAIYDQDAGEQLLFNGSIWIVIAANTTDHGALAGLGDNDHPQYLLKSGAAAMTGDLDMGGHDITNSGAITGGSVTATSAVVTDTISERTSAAGITADGVLLKDGLVDGVDVAARDADLTTAESDIATLQGEVSTLQSEMTAAEDAISTLEGGVSSLSDELTAHIGTITGNPHGVTKSDVSLGNVTNHEQLRKASNLSDVPDKTAARTNLELGNSAVLDVGADAGTVAAGDHDHAEASDAVSGFMSAADKAKLDAVAEDADVTANALEAALAALPVASVASINDIDWVYCHAGGTLSKISAAAFAALICESCG